MVPRPEVGPELMWWELRVQTTGLTENLRPLEISIGVRPPGGSSSQHQDLALSNCLQTPVLDVTGQTMSKTGIQHHPSKKKKKKNKKICYRPRSKVKNLQDQINEDEIGKLPEKEFRVMIVKMIQNLGAEWRKYKKQITRI